MLPILGAGLVKQGVRSLSALELRSLGIRSAESTVDIKKIYNFESSRGIVETGSGEYVIFSSTRTQLLEGTIAGKYGIYELRYVQNNLQIFKGGRLIKQIQNPPVNIIGRI